LRRVNGRAASAKRIQHDIIGLKRSVGHYLDFWSATLGLTLFTAGYLFHSLTNRHVCR
jgi:hypothetical protein